MTVEYVEDTGELDAVGSALERADRISLDLEAAGFHRYSDRLCLIQITVEGTTFLVDPLSVDPAPALRPFLEDPDRRVFMHGADYDLRLLDRDLGIRMRGLFDTQVAAALLGAPALGLSSLLEARLGVPLSKKYQKADWARRPLPEAMRAYAAEDTRHLEALAGELSRELEAKGRMNWALEEFRELEEVRFEDTGDEDPVLRIKAARDMDLRELARLREALDWRDGIARERDRALFRVAGNHALVEGARRAPRRIEDLEAVPGMSRELARERGPELLRRFREAEGRPQEELSGYPAPPRDDDGSRGRPPPEVEERIARLKGVRNVRAEALGIHRGTLLPNACLERLARTPPRNVEGIAATKGIRRWQAELLGEALLEAVQDTVASGG